MTLICLIASMPVISTFVKVHFVYDKEMHSFCKKIFKDGGEDIPLIDGG